MNENNIIMTIVIVVIVIVAIAIITYVAEKNSGSTTNIFPVIRPRRPNKPSQPLIGGCAGTRWGCCPDGKTARTDKHGKNCG